MAKLELEFSGFHNKIDYIYVDGKTPRLKKKDNGNRYCVVETSKPVVDVVMFKSHQYGGKHWFWWQLLCFILSVFGIFDIKQDKKCLVTDCRFSVDLKEDTKVVIKRVNYVDGGEYVAFEPAEKVNIIANKQYIDKEAQKKHKKMKKVKTGLFIGAVVVTILLLILL